MKLKDYLTNLKDLALARPETLEMDIVTSSDDEGNSFNPVHYTPSVGHYSDREFTPEDSEDSSEAANSVCVN